MPRGDGLSRNYGENAVWSGWKLRVGEKMKWTKQIYDIFISYKDDGEGRNFAARLSADLKKWDMTSTTIKKSNARAISLRKLERQLKVAGTSF